MHVSRIADRGDRIQFLRVRGHSITRYGAFQEEQVRFRTAVDTPGHQLDVTCTPECDNKESIRADHDELTSRTRRSSTSEQDADAPSIIPPSPC